MKAVYITAGFVIVGAGAWILFILINGMRRRIETVNRRRKERKDRVNGYR